MVIDGLDACIAAELSTAPSVPSWEEVWRSRNFEVRYVGTMSGWLGPVRASQRSRGIGDLEGERAYWRDSGPRLLLGRA